ncbi:MAG: hypothetical protein KJZ91_12200 [Myxococcales bacterium]|nr:hypothetical protein [Myxococcales bacterium]
MKPSSKLLRPAVAAPPPAPAVKPADLERDRLVALKAAVEADAKHLEAAAGGGVARRLDELLAAFKRDTGGRPRPITGAIAVRVIGATCGDQRPVPLPNLRVTVVTDRGVVATAVTDVTGLAVLRPGAVADAPEPDDGLDKPGKEPGAGKPAPVAQRAAAAIDPTATDKLAYRVRIAAGNGAPVAELDGEPTRTHLVQLGDDKALEGHAVLGRGWAQAIAAAEARAAEVAKPAAARVVEHLGLARDRLTAIEKRLAMLTRKA